jgi:hypothetical protein
VTPTAGSGSGDRSRERRDSYFENENPIDLQQARPILGESVETVRFFGPAL